MRLIDADALLKTFYRELDNAILYGRIVKSLQELIKEAPTIDAVPVRHAFWKSTGADEWGQCSYCGVPDKKKGAVYCRHCGAMMDGGELNDNAE